MNDAPVDPFGLEGTTLRERYAIGPVVARGGFGVVYRARQLDLDAPVALKVLAGVERFSGAAREEFLERFRQEARTLAALGHPAVARVLDFGTLPHASGELPWMALDWIEGRTLEEDLRARGALGRSPREVLDLLRPAFDALACAHEAGISHRDIKPSNLMLVKARRGDTPLRVIDFGVAKVTSPDEGAASGVSSGATATRSEVQAFSTLYAAPEQVGRTRTGPWTDVHALALVVTELLAGRRAYQGLDGTALLLEIVSAQRPTPGRHGVPVGPWEVVLGRALAVVPADRPAGAAMLFRELEASVSEAQAAWESSPRAPQRPPAPLAETLAEALPAVTPARPSEAPEATVTPPRRRTALTVALAVIAAVGLAAGLRHRHAAPTARPRAPAAVTIPPPPREPAPPREVPSAPRPAVTVVSPPATAPAPVRRPVRAAPVVRRATADVPAAAPTPVPYVAIE